MKCLEKVEEKPILCSQSLRQHLVRGMNLIQSPILHGTCHDILKLTLEAYWYLSPVLESVVHDNDGEMDVDAFEQDGECVENSHDWGGGSIRRIHLKSMFIS